MSLGPLDFKQAVTEGPTFAKYWQYKLAEVWRFLKNQVSGPVSSVDGDIAVFDGATGMAIKDGGKTIADLQVDVNAVLVNKPNFSDTTPAAPNGKRNVKLQTAASNISAYIDNLGGVNAQTGTSYTVADTDEGKLVTFSNAAAIAVTLPTSFGSTYKCFIENLGAGTATFTPSSGTINGAGSLALTTNQGCALFFDGTNWKAETGIGGSSSSGFAYRGTLTIDHTKVSGQGVQVTDFPVLIDITDNALKSVGNGGQVQNGSGYDIVPFLDANLSNQIDGFETESWDASTGRLVMHCKIPYVSAFRDTIFYIGVGKSSISTFQGTVADTWSNGYIGVWHLGDGVTLSLTDSTGLTSSPVNHGAVAASGMIGGGASFNGSSDYIDAGSGYAIDTGAITVSCWVKPSVLTRGDLVTRWTGGTTNSQFNLLYGITSGKPQFFVTDGTTLTNSGVSSAMSTGNWYYIVGRADVQRLIQEYINGVVDAGVILATLLNRISLTNYSFGRNNSPANYFQGTLDEIRIANVLRHTSWIGTEYNNQNSPGTFLSASFAAI